MKRIAIKFLKNGWRLFVTDVTKNVLISCGAWAIVDCEKNDHQR
jgi:hypothetical protein